MLERPIEEEGLEIRRRLYAHHDYFDNVIPSSWFIMGSLLGGYIFYRHELVHLVVGVRDFVGSFGEPTTGIDVLMAITLAVAVFNLVYITGHLLNGVAAVVLDRTVVKKLLRYPFTLYELKWQAKATDRPDTAILRECMLQATYLVFCVNLIPIVFFEIALVAFGRVNPYAGSWVQRNPFATLCLSLLLVVMHLGIPSWRKARALRRAEAASETLSTELAFGHIVGIVVVATAVGGAIAFGGHTWVVLLLPIFNAAAAVGDRKMLIKYGADYKTPSMKRFFQYAKYTFVNPSYFAAKLVGYAASPDATLIGSALAEAKYDSRANDFYWMCQLRLENEAPRSYDTAYHAMAMYTMNRNLCNATAFTMLASVIAFYVRWPLGYRYLALLWIGTLVILTYIFFIRYLYLFSGLYSKYVVRAAAYLAQRQASA